MKAKDLADRMNRATDEQRLNIIQDIVNDFMDELRRILKARKCTRGRAYESVFLELDQKWQAMCRRTPFVAVNGFRAVILDLMPEAYAVIRWKKIS